MIFITISKVKTAEAFISISNILAIGIISDSIALYNITLKITILIIFLKSSTTFRSEKRFFIPFKILKLLILKEAAFAVKLNLVCTPVATIPIAAAIKPIGKIPIAHTFTAPIPISLTCSIESSLIDDTP